MGCCHLVRAFRTGYKTETGADDLLRCPGSTDDIYSLDSALKRRPRINLLAAPHVKINGRIFLTDPVMQPCGKCVGCRLADAKAWKIRNCLEMTYEKECYFVTLTFDDEHLLPLRKELYVDCIQKFFKRWRKIRPCRYFLCFEFGENTLRPHFHLLFYAHLVDLAPIGINQFTSKELADTWCQGQILIEHVSPGNIAYVCGYVEKKAKDPNFYKYAFKPFRLASRNPAIGFRYLEDHRRLFGDDPHVYGNFSSSPGHNSASIPPSFKRKLKEEEYFDRLKLASELAGENAQDVSKVVYGLSDLPMLEFALEASAYNAIDQKRKTKI